MLLSDQLKGELLTDTQIKYKINAAVKAWLKERGYDKDITFHCIRGTYHFTNCTNYMLSAKDILTNATGLSFLYMNGTMARINK